MPNPALAVVLAAGQSVRMGRPKQLLPFAGRSLLAHVVDRVAGFGFAPVVVTAPAVAEQAGLPPEAAVVINPRPETGLAGSLVAGLTAAVERWAAWQAGDRWLAVFLGDQPLLMEEVVAGTRAAFLARPPGIHRVRPRIAGVPCHPTFLDAEAVRAVLRSPPAGDQGLSGRGGPDLAWVEWDDRFGRHCLDVDTPEDYARALAASQGAGDHAHRERA